MNKQQLVDRVADQTQQSKATIELVIEEIIVTIRQQTKKNEEVKLKGFGTFLSYKRKARMGRNPQTGKEIEIPATRVPKFRPSQELKEFINK